MEAVSAWGRRGLVWWVGVCGRGGGVGARRRPRNVPDPAPWRGLLVRVGSAGAAAQDTEEGLDVEVGAGVAVTVEVGGAAGRAAVAGEAGEEGGDVGIGAGVAV